ncbi:MAG: phage integrase SAM-like domain-containing protein, partial [Flavobacteriaceae bacterium]
MGVILRQRSLKSGQLSYYLDIHHNGERWREFLDIKASLGGITTAEKRRIAKQKKVNRELELLSEQTGYVPKHFRNKNFFKFAEEYIENYKLADINVVKASLSKFRESVNNERLTISQTTPRIMESYKTNLIYDASLAGETPSNYFTRFKKILKNAKISGYRNADQQSILKIYLVNL